MHVKLRPLLVLLFGSAVAAQTFVVDAANGPGTNYTSISAAVPAVPDGSTLLIRPGSYGPFVIDAKGLTLLGGAGVYLTQGFFQPLPPAVEIKNTAPGQTVVLHGFQFSLFVATATVRDCAGPVLIEDVTIGVGSCNCNIAPGTTWTIQNSSQVMLRDCTSWYGVLSNSNVALEGCTFDGYGAICALGTCTYSARPALTIQQGTTQIAGCTLRGGSGGGGYLSYPAVPNQPAIAATAAVLRILAPATIAAPATWPFIPDVQAIVGTGTLRIDPGVVVTSTVQPAIAAGIVQQIVSMPAVRGVSTTPGGTLAASALGPVGSIVILVLGFPGAPFAVAGVADEFWIDPTVYLFQAVGVPQNGVPVTGTVAVPNTAAFLGLRLAWQSVAVGASGLQASNPTWTLVY